MLNTIRPNRIEAKSPIKDKPLRQAGQSLVERRLNLMLDLVSLAMFPAFLVAFAVMEWIRAALNTPPSPWVPTVFLACSLCYAIWKGRPLAR